MDDRWREAFKLAKAIKCSPTEAYKILKEKKEREIYGRR